MNQFQQFSLVSGFPSPFTFGLAALIWSSFSSDVYNSAISPDASKSLMYTKNLSFVIYASVNKKSIPSSLIPVLKYKVYKSALKSPIPYVAWIVI